MKEVDAQQKTVLMVQVENAPDIYVQDFCAVCDEYIKLDNPLLIPETAAHGHADPRLVYTIGHYHALGFAPFGFEDMGGAFGDVSAYLFGVYVSDPLLTTPQSVSEYAWYAETLQQMMGMLTEAYGTNYLQAVISERPEDMTIRFERFGFEVVTNHPYIQRKDGVCMALQTEPDTFYLIASACMIVPFSADEARPHVDILSLEEGGFDEGGHWQVYRRLNGDEAAGLRYSQPTLLKCRLFSY